MTRRSIGAAPGMSGVRVILATCLAVGAALLIGACGGDEGAGASDSGGSEGTVTLKLQESTTNQAASEAVVKDFERKHPNIDIDEQYLASDSQEHLLLTQLQSGSAADLFRVAAGISARGTQTLAEAGKLLDLSGSDWDDRLYEPSAELYMVDGKPYAWSPAVQLFGVLYNVDLFNKLGLEVPTRMSEVLQMCKTINEAGKVPFMQGWSELPTANVWAPQRAANYVYSVDPNWDEKRNANKVKFVTSPEWRPRFSRSST